jgi:hypothetical protein
MKTIVEDAEFRRAVREEALRLLDDLGNAMSRRGDGRIGSQVLDFVWRERERLEAGEDE